ncbi:MAG: iron ABC transporter permease [Bacteroidetes bacterium]|nr:MAG: iron ABC transporter permease [Bacteroidota bacterium]
MNRTLFVTGTLLLLLPLSMGLSVAAGSVDLALADVVRVYAAHLGLYDGTGLPPAIDRIVWDLRTPRMLLALVVGGGLAVIGAAMQALVRNPLAEPYILGLSSGASAGVSLFYLGFLPPLLAQAVTFSLAAFLGGLAAITLVYLVARVRGTVSVTRLLLAGVVMSSLMGAITAFATFASPEPDKLRTLLFFLLGSLSGARWEILPLPAAVTLAGGLALLALARPLDALLLGEEQAHSLGIPVETTKRLVIVLAALVTGVLVATSGAIGFVGLIVPHVLRSLVGVPHRRLLPLSFLGGALLLLWADLGARAVLPAEELPVGVVMALVGVPFFLLLLRRTPYHFG